MAGPGIIIERMKRTDPESIPLSDAMDRALRRAAFWHREGVRKGSQTPYMAHPMAVAMILARMDFAEPVVIAGLLHDVVEDTDATLEEVRAEFGGEVADLVDVLSEVKLDANGKKRPWIDRKRDHIKALATASVEARAVALADKLHNLLSIRADLDQGRPVWTLFHAEKSQVLWYYRTCIETYPGNDAPLQALAEHCSVVLKAIEAEPATLAGPLFSEHVELPRHP